ncbi:hypothetical protein [Microbispora bryophytorum]|uniref:hypothetical protein n=1 Tax=Microbispora bryophytorum TaxID=1460882 RepID=UPI0033D06B71
MRHVVFPAVRGGEETLRDLVKEFKTKGPIYRRTVQTTLQASYTGHYRRGLIELIGVLEFRSGNSVHRPSHGSRTRWPAGGARSPWATS